jgi:hypothetical protein
MSKLDKIAADLFQQTTDIKAHLPILAQLAKGKRVAEFGTRRCVSSTALLSGRPAHLTCYDMVYNSDILGLVALAAEEGIPFTFELCNLDHVRQIKLIDFGFIDAMHNGPVVRAYIRLMIDAGATCLAFHDTESFRHVGDVEGTDGVYDAITDFLKDNPDWRIVHESKEDYGFTVISK